jgi:hypothetical protein
MLPPDLKRSRPVTRLSRLSSSSTTIRGGGLARDAAARLKVCEGKLDDYAQRIFDAHDENR